MLVFTGSKMATILDPLKMARLMARLIQHIRSNTPDPTARFITSNLVHQITHHIQRYISIVNPVHQIMVPDGTLDPAFQMARLIAQIQRSRFSTSGLAFQIHT